MNDEKFQELQMLEQNLQALLYQKQAFNMELAETESALKELKKSGEDAYKIVGNLMIKTDKRSIQEELEKKQKMLELKLKSLEKQEAPLTNQAEKIREEVMKNLKK